MPSAARNEGFALFSRTWPNGAQGKVYFPYGVDRIQIQFPGEVKSLNVGSHIFVF